MRDFPSARVAVLQAVLVAAALLLAAASETRADVTQNRYFQDLQQALSQYRIIASEGGWDQVPAGPALKPGDTDPRLLQLRQRLETTGELPRGLPFLREYGTTLFNAVVLYQQRNGLEPDGIVGPETLAALNTSVERRIRQITVNMERWRSMPADLGERYVLVNMAAFELEVIDRGETVLDMRVVVGRNYRQTPIFSDRIGYIEFNPYWNVPASIANRDLVPKFIEDPTYPRENGFHGMRGGERFDISSIDWSAYRGSRLPFELRQDPGPRNALGEMKFMFPNAYNVYLHDTPSKELFGKTVRRFSSGCIRVERPHDLAAYLLAATPDWSSARIRQALDSRKTVRANLAMPVPVHLLYMTAWIDRDGIVQFRRDIYGRDQELAQTMFGG